MANDDLRFGLIGYGLFGAHHAAAIANTPGAQLAAVAVRSDKSQAAAKEAHPSADTYGDYRELLERDDIDIVDVVLPNLMHFEVGSAVLESGKHMIMEKPMALEVAQLDALVRLAEDKGKLLAVNHELRLSSLWGAVKKLIDDDAIGHPLYCLVELSRFPYRQGSDGWRYDLERVGSWILEEPIHFFDLARWYLAGNGEAESIYARASSRHKENPKLRDNFSAIVNFPGGAYAVITQTLAAFGHHQTAKISGTKGAIWAHWGAADARSDKCNFGLSWGLGDEVREMAFDKPTGELLELAEQIAAVVDSVKNGTPPPCNGNDGRWSALLCLAAEHSVETGQPVDIEKFVAEQTS